MTTQDTNAAMPKAALITGAGKRIGRTIALALANDGWAVAIHYNSSAADAEGVVAEIAAAGGKAVALKADLAREAEVETLLPRATAALGPLGLLVNNASVFDRDEVKTVTRASWDTHMETNLRAPFVLMQGLARQLPAAAEGVVIERSRRARSQPDAALRVLHRQQGRALDLDPDHGARLGAAHPRGGYRTRPDIAEPAPVGGAVRAAGGLDAARARRQPRRGGRGGTVHHRRTLHDGIDRHARRRPASGLVMVGSRGPGIGR